MGNALDVVVSTVLSQLEKDALSEEELCFVFSQLAERVFDGSASEEPFTGYEQVRSWVNAQYAGGLYEDDDAEVVFDKGALWGAMGVYDSCVRKSKEQSTVFMQREMLHRRKELFDLVSSRPGVTHGKLAEAMGITPSALTQAVADLKDLNLLVVMRSGRSKHYYLSAIAKERLAEKTKSPSWMPQSNSTSGESVRHVTQARILPPSTSNNALDWYQLGEVMTRRGEMVSWV